MSMENTRPTFSNNKSGPLFVLPGSVRPDRAYFSPIEQNIPYLLPPNQRFVTPNYYMYNEGDFGQGPHGANYFDAGRESARVETCQKENGTNINGTSSIEIQEKEKLNSEKKVSNANKRKSTTKNSNNGTNGNDGNKESSNKESSWQDHEIDLLIQYIADNFEEYRKGKKTKMFNEMSKNILKNKEANAIKCKLARLLKTYSDIKKHNEKSGVERKDWKWYEKMDSIFGIRENISPSYIANRSTDIEGEESEGEESEGEEDCGAKFPKKLKKNNVDSIAIAISTMSKSRERVWDKKIELEREKMDKKHTVELARLANEQEKMRLEHELKMKEIELKLANNSNT